MQDNIKPCKSYNIPHCRTNLDVINNLLLDAIKPTTPEIPVHPKCPQSVLDLIIERLNATVPKLSMIFPDNPCLIYMGSIDKKHGYAMHQVPKMLQKYGVNIGLHRYIYRFLVMGGDIPDVDSNGDAWEVDHICGNTACINPTHLRLLTKPINRQLGNHQNLHMGA